MVDTDDDIGSDTCSLTDPPRLPLDKIDDEAVECTTPEPNNPVPSLTSASDKETAPESIAVAESLLTGSSHSPASSAAATSTTSSPINMRHVDHSPKALPRFRYPNTCMWTSTHAANAPSEDVSSSLVNVLLKPDTLCDEQHSLIRLSLWSVIDGHGGGCVATYTSEVLLPHIAASVSRVLDCEIVDRGECRVNGELRDANALDFDGLIQSSDKSQSNPYSIHYRAPREADDQDDKEAYYDCASHSDDSISLASSLVPRDDVQETASPAKTSVKIAASVPMRDGPTGTHSPDEVARITHTITESFLAVDEGWINSIDVLSTNQFRCQTNGHLNAGACALVVFIIQRLDWTSNPAANTDPGGGSDADGGQDTNHNRESARLRMLNCAKKGKSPSSLSTVSSTSSLVTTADCIKSEIKETEDDEENEHSGDAESHGRNHPRHAQACSRADSVINTPGGCNCHFYRGHDAMLYTAHVGDCRAVLLGNGCPGTIKVPTKGHQAEPTNTTDGDLSYHSSDETAYMSSSGHEGSSEEEDEVCYHDGSPKSKTPPHLSYMQWPARRQGIRMMPDPRQHQPLVGFPQLTNKEVSCSSDESDNERRSRKTPRSGYNSIAPRKSSGTFSDQNHLNLSPPLSLSPHMCPIDLTTDHSAYNPAEVAAVLKRCNNAAGAISSGMGGGIKRVAGSLAVTRALGDAYLKTPLLSFHPFMRHVPYITARPEVNCRLLPSKGGSLTNHVLILATDGVWEHASGEDVLRWVRNHYAERTDAEKRNRMSQDNSTDQQVANSEGKDGIKASSVKEGLSPGSQKRKLRLRVRRRSPKVSMVQSTAADVIVRRVLNKVRRSRKMSSLHDLLSLPVGRARRCKHDDITTIVVDLGAFVT